MTTLKQKKAILFCEEWTEIPFLGNINNFKDVSSYLSKHLDNAKSEYNHAYEIYSDEAMYRDMSMERYY